MTAQEFIEYLQNRCKSEMNKDPCMMSEFERKNAYSHINAAIAAWKEIYKGGNYECR